MTPRAGGLPPHGAPLSPLPAGRVPMPDDSSSAAARVAGAQSRRSSATAGARGRRDYVQATIAALFVAGVLYGNGAAGGWTFYAIGAPFAALLLVDLMWPA